MQTGLKTVVIKQKNFHAALRLLLPSPKSKVSVYLLNEYEALAYVGQEKLQTAGRVSQLPVEFSDRLVNLRKIKLSSITATGKVVLLFLCDLEYRNTKFQVSYDLFSLIASLDQKSII